MQYQAFAGRLRPLMQLASCLVMAALSVACESNASVEPAGLRRLDAAKLQQMLADGDITSVELVQAYLKRIKAYEQEYGDESGLAAIIQLNEHALQDASKLDEERANGHARGPLHGIPILLKEIYNVKGMPTPAGMGDMMRNIVAPEDALIVRKLRDAGVVILAHTDAGIANVGNPFDRTLSPGGSSAGNGAGLAAAYAPVAIGEDTMGSPRIPAAWTSTVGFRPTTGLVSMNGAASRSLTYDTPGPQATTVADIAQLMDVIAGFDPGYPASVKMNMPTTYAQYLDKNYLKGKKIGIYQPFMLASDDTVRRVIQNAAAEMAELGAELVALDDAVFAIAQSPPGTELLREVAGDRGLNPDAGFEEGSELGPSMDLWLATLHADDSELAQIAAPKDKLTQADITAAQGAIAPKLATPADRRRNARLRSELRKWFDAVVREHGVNAVIYPTVRKVPQARKWGFMWQNTSLASLLGYPAISVPAGFIDGLPVGVDIMGTAAGQDAEILGMAYAYEQGTHHSRAPASTPPLATERDLVKTHE
jgi:amidase